MATTPYVDPNTVHSPTTGTSPPAGWGTTIRNDLQTLSTPPGCVVHRTTAVAMTSGVITAVPFNSADLRDTDGYHDIVTNNTRITIPSGLGGWYDCKAAVTWAVGINSRYLGFRVNGTTEYRGAFYLANATYATHLNIAIDIYLNAGDYIEVVCFHNSSGTINLDIDASDPAFASFRWVSL